MGFFAARQPILNEDKSLFGYELLFRVSLENAFPKIDEEKATSKMIEGLMLDLGLDKLSKGSRAFINFTHQSLLKGYPLLLPKEKIVVEILETAKPSKKLYEQIKTLHDRGYIIALDDFVHDKQWEPFYPLIHIIKVDYLEDSPEQIAETIAQASKYPHIELLAEKIETNQEFEVAKSQGFKYFQGYFFAKPEVIKSVALTTSQTTLSSLLNEVSKAEPNFKTLTQIFEMDVSLSFKLLRYAQSPFFRRRKEIESIRQAVIALGKTELERFIGLLFAANFGENKPSELIRMSLQRAKFCEALAVRTKNQHEQSSAFLAGLLSLTDAMLDTHLNDVINELPLSQTLKIALLKDEGWIAKCLSACETFEKADWKEMELSCQALNTDFSETLEDYTEALAWSEQRMSKIV